MTIQFPSLTEALLEAAHLNSSCCSFTRYIVLQESDVIFSLQAIGLLARIRGSVPVMHQAPQEAIIRAEMINFARLTPSARAAIKKVLIATYSHFSLSFPDEPFSYIEENGCSAAPLGDARLPSPPPPPMTVASPLSETPLPSPRSILKRPLSLTLDCVTLDRASTSTSSPILSPPSAYVPSLPPVPSLLSVEVAQALSSSLSPISGSESSPTLLTPSLLAPTLFTRELPPLPRDAGLEDRLTFLLKLSASLLDCFSPDIQRRLASSDFRPSRAFIQVIPASYPSFPATIGTCFEAWCQAFNRDRLTDERLILLETELSRIKAAIQARISSWEIEAELLETSRLPPLASHRRQVSFGESAVPPMTVRTIAPVNRALRKLCVNAPQPTTVPKS